MIQHSSFFRAGLLAATVAFAGCGSMSPMAQPAYGGGGSSGSGSTATFAATLSSAAEVPANASSGKGSLDATLDKTSNVLKWKLTYTDLSGPATAAHFHGPAMPGSNAGVMIPFPNPASPIEGQATLTAAQVADLTAGKWYANVHTAANPGGEIRGQVLPK